MSPFATSFTAAVVTNSPYCCFLWVLRIESSAMLAATVYSYSEYEGTQPIAGRKWSVISMPVQAYAIPLA